MGFEPTTASLEGWNSTTELRPPEYRRQSCRDHNPLQPAILLVTHIEPNRLTLVGRQGFEPWKT